MRNRRWTNEEIEYLFNIYPKVGLYQTTKYLKRTKYSVESKTKRLGIKSKITAELRTKTRASTCIDLNYFDKLFKYNQGYIYGFIMADGCMHSNMAGTSIEIHKKDIDVLYFIKKELKSNQKIYLRKNRNTATITINTKIVNRRLYDIGITPRKSNTVKFPQEGNLEFKRGVISGYFDGDGCAYFDHRKKKNPLVLSFTSDSYLLLEKISLIVSENTNISKKNINQNKLQYYGNDAIKLAKWLYQDNRFHMKRKFKKIKKYLRG